MQPVSYLVDAYYVLYNCSAYLTGLALFLLTVCAMQLGRKWFEGMAYDVARSSLHGDTALIVIIVIGIGILQQPAQIPAWLNSRAYQTLCAALTGIVVVGFTYFAKPKRIMDIWHALFTVPVLTYLLLLLIPVVFAVGTIAEKGLVIFLFSAWVALVIYDFATGRLDQEKWLRARGVKAPKWD